MADCRQLAQASDWMANMVRVTNNAWPTTPARLDKYVNEFGFKRFVPTQPAPPASIQEF